VETKQSESLSVNKLTYQIGDKNILDNLGPFQMQRSDLVCISGPSGGGKTTFINLLSGLLPASAGEIKWGHHDIHDNFNKLDKLRLEWISIIFQEPRLAKNLSGWENILLPLKLSGRMQVFNKGLIKTLLDTLFIGQGMTQQELDALLDMKVSRYSGGQMQRISIIRAIISLPKYIFADEILNSLEPELQETTWQSIKQICREYKIGFLLITHNSYLLQDTDFTQNIIINKGAIANV